MPTPQPWEHQSDQTEVMQSVRPAPGAVPDWRDLVPERDIMRATRPRPIFWPIFWGILLALLAYTVLLFLAAAVLFSGSLDSGTGQLSVRGYPEVASYR